MSQELAVPTEPELVELERLALQVAEAAGDLVRERPADLGVAATKSTGTDIVTVMDQAAQDLIGRELSAARPDDGFLGEEAGGAREGTSGLTWVVDPIDGTVNYLYGLPAYAVSVAAVVGDPRVVGGWRPVAGAVVSPATAQTYHARVGAGAFRRDRGQGSVRITASPQTDLSHALVGTGFGYLPDLRRWQGRLLLEVLPQVRDIRRFGSAALDLCRVADGTLDGYFERGLNAWDIAAAWVVLREAGALTGEVRQADLVWAGAPGIGQTLERLLQAGVRAADAL